MPYHFIELVKSGLNELGKSVKGSKIAILGIAYKGNVPDTRESPAFYIIRKLEQLGADVSVYDPLVKENYGFDKVDNFDEAVKDADAIGIVTNHDEFKTIDWKKIKDKTAIIDGKGILDKECIKNAGHLFKGIGRN